VAGLLRDKLKDIKQWVKDPLKCKFGKHVVTGAEAGVNMDAKHSIDLYCDKCLVFIRTVKMDDMDKEQLEIRTKLLTFAEDLRQHLNQ